MHYLFMYYVLLKKRKKDYVTKTTNEGRMYGSPSQPRLKKRKKILNYY